MFRTALGVLGAERLLFGTDSSFFPRGWQAGLLATQVAALDAAGATPEQSRLILGGNFARLFPVLATERVAGYYGTVTTTSFDGARSPEEFPARIVLYPSRVLEHHVEAKAEWQSQSRGAPPARPE